MTTKRKKKRSDDMGVLRTIATVIVAFIAPPAGLFSPAPNPGGVFEVFRSMNSKPKRRKR